MKKFLITVGSIVAIFFVIGLFFKVLKFFIYIGFIIAAAIAIYIFFKYLTKK